MAKQLNDFISQEGFSNVHLSAYRSFHSTERALLKIQNDISTSVDSGKAVPVKLLDLVSVYKAIDYSILHDYLHDSLLFGVNKYNVAKLQNIENSFCRIVFRQNKPCYSPIFKSPRIMYFPTYMGLAKTL